MKAKQMQHQRTALTLAITSALGAAPGLAGAAGFALLEQNARTPWPNSAPTSARWPVPTHWPWPSDGATARAPSARWALPPSMH